MAKGKYQYWLSRDGRLLLQGWARKGYRDKEIAERIGISKQTFYEWKRKYPAFSDSIKKGKEVVDFEVENKLLSLALEGNITAIIFWLKNRMPTDWRDHPNVDADNQTMEKLDTLLEEFKDAVK